MVKTTHRALALFMGVVFLPLGILAINDGFWLGYVFAPVGVWMLALAIFPKAVAMAPETEMKWKKRVLVVGIAVLIGVTIYALSELDFSSQPEGEGQRAEDLLRDITR